MLACVLLASSDAKAKISLVLHDYATTSSFLALPCLHLSSWSYVCCSDFPSPCVLLTTTNDREKTLAVVHAFFYPHKIYSVLIVHLLTYVVLTSSGDRTKAVSAVHSYAPVCRSFFCLPCHLLPNLSDLCNYLCLRVLLTSWNAEKTSPVIFDYVAVSSSLCLTCPAFFSHHEVICANLIVYQPAYLHVITPKRRQRKDVSCTRLYSSF